MAIGSTGHKVNADGNVAVEFNNTINPLAENISSIELIPLETDSEHLVGGVCICAIEKAFREGRLDWRKQIGRASCRERV